MTLASQVNLRECELYWKVFSIFCPLPGLSNDAPNSMSQLDQQTNTPYTPGLPPLPSPAFSAPCPGSSPTGLGPNSSYLSQLPATIPTLSLNAKLCCLCLRPCQLSPQPLSPRSARVPSSRVPSLSPSRRSLRAAGSPGAISRPAGGAAAPGPRPRWGGARRSPSARRRAPMWAKQKRSFRWRATFCGK